MLPRMATFFRATFATDMTDDERALMQQHVAYTRQHFEAGRVLIFGPVMHESGSFGIGVLQVADEAEARRIMDNDPTVLGKLNRYELSPMHLGGAQGLR